MRRMEMNRVEGEKEYGRMVLDYLFWIERCLLLLLLIVLLHAYVLDVFLCLFVFTTCLALPFFLFCPSLSSAGPCGIGGFWLFLVDRLTIFLWLGYLKLLAGGFELPFLLHLTVCLSFLVHFIYTVDLLINNHLLIKSYQSTLSSPPPPPRSQDDETPRDVSKEVEKMMTDMEHMIHSFKKEWQEFSEERKKITKADAMEHAISSRFATLRGSFDELRSKVEEDIKTSRQDFNKDLKSVADLLHETYLVLQEDQKKRRIIRGEDVEGLTELKEQVRRLSMDLSASRVEVEMAKRELSSAAVELVEAGFQQWEEDNADYLASLHNHS